MRSINGKMTSWLSPLLGLVLLLVAGLDIVLLGGIGRAAWRRAALSEQWMRIRQEDQLQESGAQRQAQELRASIAASQDNASRLAAMLPSDAEASRQVSALRSEAQALGITITELGPGASSPSSVPLRRFTLRARGPWPQLVEFLRLAAQTALPTERIEEITLREQGSDSELSCDIIIAVRPLPSPLAERKPRIGGPTLSMEAARQE